MIGRLCSLFHSRVLSLDFPEFNIPTISYASSSDQFAIISHEVFERERVVGEYLSHQAVSREAPCIYPFLSAEWDQIGVWGISYLQMIADNMPILALRACYQYRPMMIALPRHLVRRAVLAWFASECELIGRFFPPPARRPWGLWARRRESRM